jgi:tRNA pseudouridine13 synthase
LPLFRAEIRQQPSDFQVTELGDFEFSGEGEHACLWIEKTAANTEWTARQLARFAAIPARDVGYAGLKDRHAITRQWFSVRAPASLDWSGFEAEGVRILEQRRHHKKLRRGAHRGNRFRIALRSGAVGGVIDAVSDRLQAIATSGVPNYFGEQRFGRGGANLGLAEAWARGKRLPRHKRSIAISTARSAIFNAILDRREQDGSWNAILPGEMANLDGSGSVFSVDQADDELKERCAAFDIHPTATLWGDGAPLGSGAVAELENEVAAGFPLLVAALTSNRVDAGSRALRLVVRNLAWEFGEDVLWLEFELPKGGYATTVLSNLAEI